MMNTTFPLSDTRFILTGLTPTALANVAMQVNLAAMQNGDGLPDVVASARVTQTDSTGKVLQWYDVADPSTVSTAAGTAFGLPVDVGVVGGDSVLMLSNSGTASANVTATLRPDTNGLGWSPPAGIASAQMSVAPGTVAQTISQMFPGVSHNQLLVIVASVQPVALGVSGLWVNTDGSMLSTRTNFFTLAPMPAPAGQQ